MLFQSPSVVLPIAALTQFDALFTRKADDWNDLRDHYAAGYASVGMDVVAVGDSLFGTMDAVSTNESRNFYAIMAVCRRTLQMLINDPAIKGGMGFVNFTNGGAAYARNATPMNNGGLPPTPGVDGDTYLGLNVGANGVGARETGLAGAKVRYHGCQMIGSGSTAGMEKRAVKKFCIVGRKYNGGPVDSSIQVSTAAWPLRASGTVVNTVWDMSNATTFYGARSPIYTITNELLDNRLAVFGGLGAPVAYHDGAMLFNGDEGSHCARVHEGGHPGLRWNLVSEGSLVASIDSFCRRDGSPGSNARNLILSSLINEANNYPAQSIQQFEDLAGAMIQRGITQGCKVTYLIPAEPDFSIFYAGTVLADAYRPMRERIYRLQSSSAFRGHMEILDAGVLNRNAAYSDSALFKGVYDDDKTHIGFNAHQILGIALAYRIAAGYFGVG